MQAARLRNNPHLPSVWAGGLDLFCGREVRGAHSLALAAAHSPSSGSNCYEVLYIFRVNGIQNARLDCVAHCVAAADVSTIHQCRVYIDTRPQCKEVPVCTSIYQTARNSNPHPISLAMRIVKHCTARSHRRFPHPIALRVLCCARQQRPQFEQQLPLGTGSS